MRNFILLSTLLLSIAASAQDRYFTRTYTSNVLPKGAIDLEYWHIARMGHSNQYYHAQEQRMEIEFGLGKKWQTAFYFNRYQKIASDSNDVNIKSNEIGFSNEWKWKIVEGKKHRPGIALYAEWAFKGGDELELETKIIIDKSIRKHLLAFNAIMEMEKEFEWEKGKLKTAAWKKEIELDFAYMYNIKYEWGIGFESILRNGINDESNWEYAALFGGPTINYRTNNWFLTFNYLPQWRNLHKTVAAPFSKVLQQQERNELGIVLGISLK